MKAQQLLQGIQEAINKHGNFTVHEVFQTDYGDELVLQGPAPDYKRIYIPFPDPYGCGDESILGK